MPPETEVIPCPACRHLLRVPADWLGTTVQCPECHAMFRAPIRQGDRLTEPELLSEPANGRAVRRPGDAALWLPAFGLMLVGIAGLSVDGFFTFQFWAKPNQARATVKNQIQAMRQFGVGADDPEDQRDKLDNDRAEQVFRMMRLVYPAFAGLSAVVFAGGLALALRKGRRLAQLSCVLACLNVPNLCCVPGAVFGIWGLLLTIGDEGRDHFR